MHQEWLERWRVGRIGWHEDEGNACLKSYWRASGRTVLVPLCGKTPDMQWLAGQGNRVVGVELSPLAIEAFFAEHKVDYTVRVGKLPAYQSADEAITIYCGDYFELTGVQFDAHYDRGAFIAIPPDLRPAYAAHTSSLLQVGAEQLVITLEYDQAIADGPPFSVSDDELLSYWPDLVCLDAHDDLENGPPKFIEAGLAAMTQKVWRSR